MACNEFETPLISVANKIEDWTLMKLQQPLPTEYQESFGLIGCEKN